MAREAVIEPALRRLEEDSARPYISDFARDAGRQAKVGKADVRRRARRGAVLGEIEKGDRYCI